MKSNLKNTQVLNKILKSLESKKLIKAVKSVNVSILSVFEPGMSDLASNLARLAPNGTHLGGTFKDVFHS